MGDLLGADALGRRIRYPDEDDATECEVIGIVAGMDRAVGPAEPVAVYRPLRPGRERSLQVYLRTANAPATISPRVVDAIVTASPRFVITNLQPLDQVWRPVEQANIVATLVLGVVAGILLLFASMGVYALMSFAGAQRAREIGVRIALGAPPRRVLGSIFARAVAQVGVGVVLGSLVVSLTVARDPDGRRLVALVAAGMATAGLLACVVPATRALRVQPIESLRSD